MTLMIILLAVANIYAIQQGVYGDYRAIAFGGNASDLRGILVQLPVLFDKPTQLDKREGLKNFVI